MTSSQSLDDAALIEAHEKGISAFLAPRRAARYDVTRGSRRGRARIQARLSHHARDLDARYATKLSSALGVSEIEELLRAADAPSRCYVLSKDSDIDGRMLDLHEALDTVVAYAATIISCVPGALGLFVDEPPDGHWLLERRLR